MKFQAEWYLKRYPAARDAVASGRFASAREHFAQEGHYLGYRAFPKGERFIKEPERYYETLQKKGFHSTEKGLQEKERQSFLEQGYCILEKRTSSEELTKASAELEEIYDGNNPNVKFAWKGGSAWGAEIKDWPAKALDIHFVSDSILNLVTGPSICRALREIFGCKPLLSQTLGFYRGSGQRLHQDTAFVTYSRPSHFVGVWFALEDVTEGAGELVYVPGSHKLDHYLFGSKYLSYREAIVRNAIDPDSRDVEIRSYLDYLDRSYKESGLTLERFLPKKGDVLIWDARLAHGGGQISLDASRKSVVAHFCPHNVVPQYFEHQVRTLKNAGESFYSTYVY